MLPKRDTTSGRSADGPRPQRVNLRCGLRVVRRGFVQRNAASRNRSRQMASPDLNETRLLNPLSQGEGKGER